MAYEVDLSGRRALVTGGSRGIGRAIALTLAECGAAVAVNFRTHAEEADAVVRQILSAGGRAIAVGADGDVGAEVSGLAERVAREFGPIDILVNNAGIALEDSSEEAFDRTIAANLKSAFLLTEAVLPGCGRAIGDESSTSPPPRRGARGSSASPTTRRRPGSRA
jgi:3-oxoacyl-[acyl-carrier protein] reductase